MHPLKYLRSIKDLDSVCPTLELLTVYTSPAPKAVRHRKSAKAIDLSHFTAAMVSTEKGTLTSKHDELKEDTQNEEMTSGLDVAESPFAASLGREVVEIRVGPNQKSFWLSKETLCSKIPYFDKMFNGGFKEASESCATLPEECPKLFDVLVEWVYTGKIRPITFDSSGETGDWNYNPCGMYILLERYCLWEHLDAFMDELRKACVANNAHPTRLTTVKAVYSESREGSPLRRFVAQSMYYILVKYESRLGKSHETSKIQINFEEVDGLLRDVLDLMRGQSGKEARDPRTGPNCDFHRHGKSEACPIKK